MEELFNGQLSFADIEAEKFLQIRRTHADRRVNAMDRLTDDVINELIQLCLPLYHIKANHGRPYTRLETMVRVHLLQVSLNLSDLEMESYLASDMVARSFCRVSSTHQFISDSTILSFRHFIEQYGLAQKFLERTEIQAIPFKDVSWYIAAKPSAWKKELSISENFGGELGQALVECVNVRRHLEHAKASVRCSIEWSFLWLKRIYGYAKVRYRGLAKNHSRAQTLFALYNCYRLRKWCALPELSC